MEKRGEKWTENWQILKNNKITHPFVAHELLVADGLVGLEVGVGALRSRAVTEAFSATPVVVTAFVTVTKFAVVGATGTLQWNWAFINDVTHILTLLIFEYLLLRSPTHITVDYQLKLILLNKYLSDQMLRVLTFLCAVKMRTHIDFDRFLFFLYKVRSLHNSDSKS